MNENDLSTLVSDASGLSKADAIKATDAVFDCIATQMRQGNEVKIAGFGTFLVTRRAASKGRNPRTGVEMDIPASNQPKFKASKGLKDAVN